MTDPTYTINVIAHRLFGTRYEVVEGLPDRDPPNLFHPIQVLPQHLRFRRQLQLFTDYEHGTTRSEENIRALFTRNPAYRYPGDKTLNDIYAPAGIQFRLVGVLDQTIESHLADFALHSQQSSIARRFHQPDAINIYLIREIPGAFGTAQLYSPHVPASGYLFLADRDGTPFSQSHATLIHEFGHVLGLPHMPYPENLMHTWSSDRTLRLEPPQIPILRHHASLLAADPLVAGVPLIDPGLLIPRREGFRAWEFDIDLEEG